MELELSIVDAFTTQRFSGNPAAVVILDAWLDPSLMQAIACENNLSETAFVVAHADGLYDIRWFSPLREIDFCGHATLASAHVLMSRNHSDVITFRAPAVGQVQATRRDGSLIELAFPNLAPEPVASPPDALARGLGQPAQAWLRNRQAWFAVLSSEAQVRAIAPDLALLKTLGPLDVVVTAPGDTADFVSRYFWPANGGEEDPVTGSIHAGLAPYWAGRLGKSELVAFQASARGGQLHCRVEGQTVHVAGACVDYLQGQIRL